ncbi:hypothetical protein M407DRAFT_13038 [Tulasnella calospora MUT 4182]|uniref:Uncharacterized protein n=1 Tax=Tulasnella calospora MUT 4182 TaxID=1051891 RepID=A0A0C3K2K7_9AGAM|nr:hypothetical protein M407DRAFT_13200 [Tulasnella calospora MUT 4182]KIO15983.1 hypothetical protein M407DRAFT_13038 [Tulasnella calospora MUT 4182]
MSSWFDPVHRRFMRSTSGLKADARPVNPEFSRRETQTGVRTLPNLVLAVLWEAPPGWASIQVAKNRVHLSLVLGRSVGFANPWFGPFGDHPSSVRPPARIRVRARLPQVVTLKTTPYS